MRPTRWPVLVAVATVVAALGYLATDRLYEDLPSPGLYSVFWIAFLALVELYVAVVTRARLQRRTGTKPIHPLTVARLAALSKASSVAGAIIAGAYAGFLAWVVQRTSTAADRDTRTAAVGVGFSLLLVLAALVLEHVCRVKGDDDD